MWGTREQRRCSRQQEGHRSPVPVLWLSVPMVRGDPSQAKLCRNLTAYRNCSTSELQDGTKPSFNFFFFFTPLKDVICVPPEPSGKAGRHTARCLDSVLRSGGLAGETKRRSPHHGNGPYPEASTAPQSTRGRGPDTPHASASSRGLLATVCRRDAAWAASRRAVCLLSFLFCFV